MNLPFVLYSHSDPAQFREFKSLINVIGERAGYHEQDEQADTPSQFASSGQQELFPGSGVFLSSFRLAAAYQASGRNCTRLFHQLFDCLFTAEECKNAVPFGRHHKAPEGKTLLDQKKVDGITSTFSQKYGIRTKLSFPIEMHWQNPHP